MEGAGKLAQCCACGEYITVDEVAEDDTYIDLYCPRCRQVEMCLYVGNRDDMYIYYDQANDPRFFDYSKRTK